MRCVTLLSLVSLLSLMISAEEEVVSACLHAMNDSHSSVFFASLLQEFELSSSAASPLMFVCLPQCARRTIVASSASFCATEPEQQTSATTMPRSTACACKEVSLEQSPTQTVSLSTSRHCRSGRHEEKWPEATRTYCENMI